MVRSVGSKTSIAATSERGSWPWRQWVAHPTVARAVNRRISGDPDRTLPQALAETLPEFGIRLPAARTASLGCGRGRFDRELFRHLVVDALIGYDLSPESIEAADRWARSAGIESFTYRQADLNAIKLEPQAFDLIVVQMALHHTFELERLYDAIAQALKPGGLLVADEYVGPTRFCWTERQMQTVNGLLTLLPPEKRINPDGIFKPLIARQPPSFFDETDPSEAIRSGEVVARLEERFDIRWRRPYGGTILHPMLHDIAWAFKEGDPLSEALLGSAIAIEDALIEARELDSDFAVIIASPR